MGVVKTRYEDSENNNVVFDSSKFDFSYTTNTFPSDSQTDFENIIEENGDGLTIKRTTTNTRDMMGNTETYTLTSFGIIGYITDVTKKDREISNMGNINKGDRILYCKNVYETISGGTTTTNTVKENDILIDRDNNEWRIITIVKEPYFNDKQIYKKCVIRSIDLEGSS